ncbi:MAG: glutamate--tRNA ligase [Candidatus Omnitrophica bacterium]|nr:glutamate--tRNA ligase [Candidatus Omnitrophota bacterium]
MNKVRVRFAPSPTGYLHVGSARTALFNWLFARHEGGEFILRIEDTDKARSKPEFLEEILESIKWLGLNWDGEVYFQSKRMGLYSGYAKKLIDAGFAYESEGAVHFRMPRKKLKISDIAHGDIEFDTSLIKDQVLIKSDGTPTYNFAVVVDDADMGMTHIIRGDDHISNTPKQVVIYEALGIEAPKFCHIPLILGVDRSRLSKRHGATSIRDYREEGYLAEALVNYLCNLGWSMGEDREIFSIDETIKGFGLENISRTAAVFDINKLNWMNGMYIKGLTGEKILGMLVEVLKKEGLYNEAFNQEWLGRIAKLYQERIRTAYDFIEMADFFFKDTLEYDPDGVKNHFGPGAKDTLKKIAARFEALPQFDSAILEKETRALADELGIKAAKLIHPARLAATGRTVGAGLFETLEILGKDRTVERLNRALDAIA